MPRFRPDLKGLVTYVPGRPIEEVAREAGIDPEAIVKIASNESPEGPFPGVVEAVAETTRQSNRYPDSDVFDLTKELGAFHGVSEDNIWTGAGSTGLLSAVATGVGGPGTSAVYAWPSFVMYRIISRWAATRAIEVPLDDSHTHDLEAMRAAVEDDTTLVYVCNPNNPTGTVVSGGEMVSFIDSLPESVLVVLDEAYHEFVSDPGYRTAKDLALERPNVLVLRTFSKVYALAAFRVGYAFGDPEALALLRRTQAPFTVSSAAQTAALVSLAQPGEVMRRVASNATGRSYLLDFLSERGIQHCDSETNFVFMKLGEESKETADQFTGLGVIVRPMSGGWIRVTVGLSEENEKFAKALDQIVLRPRTENEGPSAF